jgi:hypothetical protein
VREEKGKEEKSPFALLCFTVCGAVFVLPLLRFVCLCWKLVLLIKYCA